MLQFRFHTVDTMSPAKESRIYDPGWRPITPIFLRGNESINTKAFSWDSGLPQIPAKPDYYSRIPGLIIRTRVVPSARHESGIPGHGE